MARSAALALRPIDRSRAQETHSIAAISHYVADRIRFAWRRESEVIYPPVQVELAQSIADWRTKVPAEELAALERLPQPYVLGASRFIPYKRLDLVIEAGEAAGLPVVLAGAGPGESSLRARAASATVPVHFVIAPSNALLFSLYQAALVFVFPPVEDFGIMPIEAMALGTPVVANRIGGSAETVADGLSGIHFDTTDRSELGRAVVKAAELRPSDAQRWSEKFDANRFNGELAQWVQGSL
jgi:glycosyltransferase involved in cell wall biosynthesis